MVDKSLLNRIADSKSYYSTFAISIIILSHLVVVDSSLPLVKIFTPGFIGVDIFLFYSGYTLGFSYTRRTTKDFYLQRIKRIVPMFLVFATLSSLVHIAKGEHLSLLDWACNLSTLSYYGLGGFAIDWYLSSIFLFYLAYPLLFAFVEKARTGGVILLSVCVLCLIALVDFREFYGCAISRIPIYCFGIWFYQNCEYEEQPKKFLILTSTFMIVLCLGVLLQRVGYYMHGYFLVDMLCPTLLLGVAFVLQLCRSYVKSTAIVSSISYLGNHSLEIYIANYLSMGMMGLFAVSDCYAKAGLYLVLNIALSISMIATNKMISKVL